MNNRDINEIKIESCGICGSNNQKYLDTFYPFYDESWGFEIIQCCECGTRYTKREKIINYHEMLHKVGCSYESQYRIAEVVKNYLGKGQIKSAIQYLRKSAWKYGHILDIITRKKAEGKVLEVGCSTGYMTAVLNKIGYSAEGVDISDTAVDFARKIFGPFFNIRPQEMKYDIIFHLGLIGCVDSPKEFLLSYLRMMNPGGVMIFNAPNVEAVTQIGELWVDTPPPNVIYLFKESSFRKMLEKNYHVEISKIKSKSQIVRKSISKLLHRPYSVYPQIFKRYSREIIVRNNNYAKRLSGRILKNALSLLYHLNILHEYYDDYGLFVTVTDTIVK